MAAPGRWKRRVLGTKERGTGVKLPRKMSRRKAREKMAKRKFLVCYWLHDFEEEERLLLRFKLLAAL